MTIRWLRSGFCLAVLPIALAFCSGHGDAWSQAKPAAPPPATESRPQLVDITRSTKIQFDHLSSPAKRYIVESMSGGVALIDYDRDGWPDIYFTNAPGIEMALAGQKAKSALFHNNHDGTFTDVTDKAGVGYPGWAMGASIGDYDNDGWPDLLVTCFGGVTLYRNNHDGTFRNVTAEAGLASDAGWATGAAFGDYDGDGWVDLFVAHYVALNLKELPEFGSKLTCQYHGIPVQCGPRGLKGSGDNLYHNDHGTFTDVAKAAGVDDAQQFFGMTAVWSDFNRDGRLDLFVANDGERNYLYRNEGGGHFAEVALDSGVAVNLDGTEQANMGVALADYEHKGLFSIAITHFSEEYAALYRNDGNLSFTDVSHVSGIAGASVPYVGWGVAFFDLNNDGWPDLIIGNGHVYPQVDTRDIGTKYREPKLVFRNQHNGKFVDISKLAGPAIQIPQVSRGLAVGDLFNDGHLEIVIENLEGEPMILRTQGGERNHWINFELQSGKGNRLALNARIRLTAGDLVQEDEVRSGGSYLSQNDLRLHFGLGAHEKAEKVEIFWPSGKVETLAGLNADHFYIVREGDGVVPSR
jgi:enediyne biosynthesis protein E4